VLTSDQWVVAFTTSTLLNRLKEFEYDVGGVVWETKG